ncbi:hypothetical protein [Romboutsia lituseburensis]|uniref:hypothetical protein n=1 Tax=Romboutsia lituseburensis TaxID=1537 RepID=UPI001472DB4B|nr:hypothetical protein [Romboutsia lituseburensis]
MPASTFNGVCYNRLYAQNSSDTYQLPYGREYIKKWFWLDGDYIFSVVKYHKRY